MKRSMLAVFLLALVSSAVAVQAADAPKSCEVQATEKKLSGAARNSFMKKCETDARAACEVQATEKKLAGAARNSFVKKCESDATGTQ